MYQQTIAECD